MGFDRIVGLGLSVLDEFFRVDGQVFDSPRIRYERRDLWPGGMMGTALVQAARLGCRTELLSMLGRDPDGRTVLRELQRQGVGTRRVIRSEEHPTTIAVVLVDRRSGERRFIVPDRRRLEAAAPDFDLRGITRRSILMIDGHFPTQALRAVRRARQVGAPVVADFHTPRPDCLRLLPYVDYPILPEEFCKAWGKGDVAATLAALREVCGGVPVITVGHRGALALVGGRVRRIPARRVKVRDTTGAGDAFHGAFAAGLYRGDSTMDALALASRAAARCCAGEGGWDRLLRFENARAR